MKDWLIERKIYVLIGTFIALGGIYYFFGSDIAKPSPVNTLSMEEKFQADGQEIGNKQPEKEPELPEK
ncbi:MAG: hypothetical protein ACJ8MO_28340, partial [Bacillus sp. (in: firmicutes)]